MPFVIGRAGWPQDVANLRNKLKSLSFSRVSEVALGLFLGFLCYGFGTKLGGVLPLRMCHKAMPFVIWRAGWLQDVANLRNKLEKSQF